jgi:hypothetical protein
MLIAAAAGFSVVGAYSFRASYFSKSEWLHIAWPENCYPLRWEQEAFFGRLIGDGAIPFKGCESQPTPDRRQTIS